MSDPNPATIGHAPWHRTTTNGFFIYRSCRSQPARISSRGAAANGRTLAGPFPATFSVTESLISAKPFAKTECRSFREVEDFRYLLLGNIETWCTHLLPYGSVALRRRKCSFVSHRDSDKTNRCACSSRRAGFGHITFAVIPATSFAPG